MSEYPFVNIRIDICQEGDKGVVRVYEQRLLIDFLSKKCPDWLAQIISILNDLEVKNGKR